MLTLTYTIVNAQVVTTNRVIELDGMPATVDQPRTIIEATPTDEMGKTFSAVLPADAIDAFPEGATLTLTLDVETPDNG